MVEKCHRIIIYCWAILLCIALSGCRDTVRYLIDKLGAPDKEEPAVFHAIEGYSPGKKRNRGIENFDRYHYYISPDTRELFIDNNYPVYNDYTYDDSYVNFDEQKYWEENHLEFPDVNAADEIQHTDIE